MRFDGDDLTSIRADLRVVRGIRQVPEGRGIFPGMTVAENIDMGAYVRKDRRSPGFAAELERVYELFPRLAGAGRRSAARSPAASSRCSRSAAP